MDEITAVVAGLKRRTSKKNMPVFREEREEEEKKRKERSTLGARIVTMRRTAPRTHARTHMWGVMQRTRRHGTYPRKPFRTLKKI